MNDIETREDIYALVGAFYAKIRKDTLLGPIFNAHITDNKWPVHIDKLTDFWETNLFGVPKFKGSPSQKHVNVDQNMNHGIDQFHFESWLKLWFETIEEMFSGDNAVKAKLAAQRMAHGQFLVVWGHRQKA